MSTCPECYDDMGCTCNERKRIAELEALVEGCSRRNVTDHDRIAELEAELAEIRDDITFLLSFVPAWAKDVPAGLACTFYGTLSEEGDRSVKARVDKIRDRVKLTVN